MMLVYPSDDAPTTSRLLGGGRAERARHVDVRVTRADGEVARQVRVHVVIDGAEGQLRVTLGELDVLLHLVAGVDLQLLFPVTWWGKMYKIVPKPNKPFELFAKHSDETRKLCDSTQFCH